MPTESTEKKSFLKTILKSFNYFMVLFYIIIGTYMLISVKLLNYLSPVQKNGIGILLIVYGLFRGYRVYKNNLLQ